MVATTPATPESDGEQSADTSAEHAPNQGVSATDPAEGGDDLPAGDDNSPQG